MPDHYPRVKWPRTFPICAFAGIIAALLISVTTALIQIRLMEPLQRLYVTQFLKSSAVPFRLTVKLVEVNALGRGYIMAVDPWILVSGEQHRLKLTVTKAGIAAGVTNPRVYVANGIKPQTIRPFFEHSIYHAAALQTFRPTLISFCILFAAGLFVGAWFDQKHQEAVRRGVQIRGPRLVNPRKAQKYLKGDGIALFLQPKTR